MSTNILDVKCHNLEQISNPWQTVFKGMRLITGGIQSLISTDHHTFGNSKVCNSYNPLRVNFMIQELEVSVVVPFKI